MNFQQVGIVSLTLGSFGIIDLGLLLLLVKSDQKYVTLINVQLFLMIIAYLGIEFSGAYLYLYRGEIRLVQTQGVQIATYIFFFFVALAECIYLYHSWLRAKTILFYQNKLWYKLFDGVLKITSIVVFAPFVLQGIAYFTRDSTVYLTALVIVGLTGIIIFIFDCLIIYSFSKFFFLSKFAVAANDPKYKLIAKHGIIASVGVLLTVTCIVMSISLIGDLEPIGSIFVCFANFFLQIPIWSFLTLKRVLKENKDVAVVDEPPVASKGFN